MTKQSYVMVVYYSLHYVFDRVLWGKKGDNLYITRSLNLVLGVTAATRMRQAGHSPPRRSKSGDIKLKKYQFKIYEYVIHNI